MAAALRLSSAAAVRRALRISRDAFSTLPSASRPATVAPFSRSVAANSGLPRFAAGANNAFSWNFRRLLSSNKKHLPAMSDPEIEALLKEVKDIDLVSSNKEHLPAISDPEIETALKNLISASWNELPHSLVEEAKKAVSKATDDVVGQEALKNVFRAAEACEEFGGTLVTLRTALDDLCGLTGVVVGPLPGYVEHAVISAFSRYIRYLESFDPDEYYLRKKVHTELRTKMLHLKMRCSGIRPEWLKIFISIEFLRKPAVKSRGRSGTSKG